MIDMPEGGSFQSLFQPIHEHGFVIFFLTIFRSNYPYVCVHLGSLKMKTSHA